MELKTMIEAQKKQSFVKEYQAKETDEEALGTMISHYFEWDGLAVLKTLSAALEDANFHKENEVITAMIENLEKGA